MRRLFFEGKIMGVNALLIYVAVTLVTTGMAYLSGSLLNMGVTGFEVIYPFLTAIAVGEWGKTRADANFDSIAAQSKSLFRWVAARAGAVFLAGSIFALLGMIIVSLVRGELPVWQIALLYFSPAFFLSSLSVLGGVCFQAEHIPTLVSGTVWLLHLLARALLRIPGVAYVYLFIRHAGDTNTIWLANKLVVLAMGLGLWLGVYVICKKRVFMRR